MYMRDGDREVLIEGKSKDVALNSARVWKWYGAKPFIEQGSQSESKL
jgi:hypothetical protein